MTVTTTGPTLHRGDVFVTEGSMGPLSEIIRAAEKLIAHDNAAHYGHAGIITSTRGDTLESLWTVRHGHLDAYVGQRVLIARPVGSIYRPAEPPPLAVRDQAIEMLKQQHFGRIYPVWRLPLHIVPWLARILSTGRWLACGELTARYLVLIAARDRVYAGANPDTLADEWIRWRNFEVIFEGVWGGDGKTQNFQG